MRVAVRPHNDIRKLFIAFAISFLAMHQLVITFLAPSSKITTDAKTCVETDTNQFYCSDDPKEARKRARKTTNYYLTNFGVRQTIEGSGEEQKKMIAVSAQMEQYLKTWITRYHHIESLKEKWYVFSLYDSVFAFSGHVVMK